MTGKFEEVDVVEVASSVGDGMGMMLDPLLTPLPVSEMITSAVKVPC